LIRRCSRQAHSRHAAAHALEDAVADERLQQGLEMARRQALPARERLGRDRLPARVERDVDHGGDGEDALRVRSGMTRPRGDEDDDEGLTVNRTVLEYCYA